MLKVMREGFGYVGESSYIYPVLMIKIKVMSYMKHHLARLEMMMAEEQGNDLPYKQAYNDQLQIEANGIKIELHKQDTLRRIGIIK
jgi:hypothetical protein